MFVRQCKYLCSVSLLFLYDRAYRWTHNNLVVIYLLNIAFILRKADVLSLFDVSLFSMITEIFHHNRIYEDVVFIEIKMI